MNIQSVAVQCANAAVRPTEKKASAEARRAMYAKNSAPPSIDSSAVACSNGVAAATSP